VRRYTMKEFFGQSITRHVRHRHIGEYGGPRPMPRAAVGVASAVTRPRIAAPLQCLGQRASQCRPAVDQLAGGCPRRW
jgi:hypothetical protein